MWMLAYVSQLVVQGSLSGKHMTCVLSHIFALDIHMAATFNWRRSANRLVTGCAMDMQCMYVSGQCCRDASNSVYGSIDRDCEHTLTYISTDMWNFYSPSNDYWKHIQLAWISLGLAVMPSVKFYCMPNMSRYAAVGRLTFLCSYVTFDKKKTKIHTIFL
jgi:hypothetical protein